MRENNQRGRKYYLPPGNSGMFAPLAFGYLINILNGIEIRTPKDLALSAIGIKPFSDMGAAWEGNHAIEFSGFLTFFELASGYTYLWGANAFKTLLTKCNLIIMTIRKRELTKREGQLLKLITAGKTNLEIAERLEISVKTVETHKHNILIKLGAESSKDLKRSKFRKRG